MLENVNTEIRVEMVHPDTLKFAPFNPPIRTTSRSVQGLKSEIERAGKIISPLIVTYENYVADGHRRLTVARELGYELVPIIREDYSLADLWSILNGGNMSVNKKNWMQAVREGMPIDCVPDRERRTLEDLIRIMGRKGFEKIVDDGRGPSIIVVAQYVARYCNDISDKFVRKIVNWFIECGTLRDAKYAVSTGCPSDVLIAAIEEKRTIRQYWGMSA